MKNKGKIVQLLAVLVMALTIGAANVTYALGQHAEAAEVCNSLIMSEKGETIAWLVGLAIAIVLLVIFIDRKTGRH